MSQVLRFRCPTCDEVHSGIPDLAFGAPAYFEQLSEEEREARAVLTPDTCVINDTKFFIRGFLEIPIREQHDAFGWGVWVSLSEINFKRYVQFFDIDPPAGEGPYFGWFSNRLPRYPDTLNLKTQIHLQPGGDRPKIELEPTEHPLALHQRDGISLEELVAILGESLHGKPGVYRNAAG